VSKFYTSWSSAKLHCKSKDVELIQDEMDEMANGILNVMEDPNWNHNSTAELIRQTRTIQEKAVKIKRPASVDEKYEQTISACSWPTTAHSSRQLCRLPRQLRLLMELGLQGGASLTKDVASLMLAILRGAGRNLRCHLLPLHRSFLSRNWAVSREIRQLS
jgi:hypothetical protein